jgi:hypothetical protein
MKDKDPVKSFAKFVTEMLHHREEIIKTFEISDEVLDLWASGNHNPSPALRHAVWGFLNELQLQDDVAWKRHNEDKTKEIVEVINRFDPQGLLRMGAPQDEYEGEAHDISRVLRSENNLHDFRLAVWAVFVYNFGVRIAGSSIYYNEMAEKIWNFKG